MTKEQLWMFLLRHLVGIREIGGSNQGPHIEKFLAYCGLVAGQPYCLAALRYCIGKVDDELGGARSLLPMDGWTVGLGDWAEKHGVLLRNPVVPSIVLWRSEKHPDRGHAGGVVDLMGNGNLRTVEFNTTSGAGDQRDGDGCFDRTRSPVREGDLVVRGYVKPW